MSTQNYPHPLRAVHWFNENHIMGTPFEFGSVNSEDQSRWFDSEPVQFRREATTPIAIFVWMIVEHNSPEEIAVFLSINKDGGADRRRTPILAAAIDDSSKKLIAHGTGRVPVLVIRRVTLEDDLFRSPNERPDGSDPYDSSGDLRLGVLNHGKSPGTISRWGVGLQVRGEENDDTDRRSLASNELYGTLEQLCVKGALNPVNETVRVAR